MYVLFLNPDASVKAWVKLSDLVGDMPYPLDQWDWPGERETTVPQADWASAEYYVVYAYLTFGLLVLLARAWLPDVPRALVWRRRDDSIDTSFTSTFEPRLGWSRMILAMLSR